MEAERLGEMDGLNERLRLGDRDALGLTEGLMLWEILGERD